MLLAVTVLCLWLALHMRATDRQRTAVAWLRGAAAQCYYDYQLRKDGMTYATLPPPGPAWLRDWLGIDHFATVDCVVLWDQNCVGEALPHIQQLKGCRQLFLQFQRPTDMTSEDLARLATLKQLRLLLVQLPADADRLLAGLVPLKNLESLSIAGKTKITDAGLISLAELKSLRHLDALIGFAITETNLTHLRKLIKLRELDLCDSDVSESDVAQIQNALPNCKIVRSGAP
ncbi:MAG TPA: hypothetical protein VHC22_24220 [Pirellulales bacterium]|nr:hypothetical protein [Pirellulales bacterium]